MYICIYINIYIYRRANGIYIQKSCSIWTVCPCYILYKYYDHSIIMTFFVLFIMNPLVIKELKKIVMSLLFLLKYISNTKNNLFLFYNILLSYIYLQATQTQSVGEHNIFVQVFFLHDGRLQQPGRQLKRLGRSASFFHWMEPPLMSSKNIIFLVWCYYNSKKLSRNLRKKKVCGNSRQRFAVIPNKVCNNSRVSWVKLTTTQTILLQFPNKALTI